MAMYCGVDLHANNSYVAIQDDGCRDVACLRIPNDLGRILGFLEQYREELEAIAVESTYNWYWLVDGLKEADYTVRLVNTTQATVYGGLKYTDDRHDARWICRMQVLGILPEGYIMPPEERAVRDLLRRRSYLVRQRSSHLTSLKTVIARSTGKQVPTSEIQRMDAEAVWRLVGDKVVAESIDVVLPIVRLLSRQIRKVERSVLEKSRLRDEFQLLRTAPGIGEVLALTIMCETGTISRFKKVGNYTSYCRTVKSERTSNGKKKGQGNRKNGNKYLSWAYSEAAHHATRFEPLAKRYLDRKMSRKHPMVAKRSLANKMARGCYFVLRNQVPFDPSRLFC